MNNNDFNLLIKAACDTYCSHTCPFVLRETQRCSNCSTRKEFSKEILENYEKSKIKDVHKRKKLLRYYFKKLFLH